VEYVRERNGDSVEYAVGAASKKAPTKLREQEVEDGEAEKEMAL